MESVLITLKSQVETYNDKEEVELMTTGMLENKADAVVLTYEDTEATGFAGSRTIIQMTDDSLVTILRTGTANSNLILEPEKKHHCLYETPFGSMMIGVKASKIVREIEADKGRLLLEYTMDIDGTFMSVNTMEVAWKQQ